MGGDRDPHARPGVAHQEFLAIRQMVYVEKLLEQADSWKDTDTGHPKQKYQRYFYKGHELACDAYDVMPGMAQFKALELVGKILGYVPDGRDTQPSDVSFVVGMPVMCKTAEEWWEHYGTQLAEQEPNGRQLLPPAAEGGSDVRGS